MEPLVLRREVIPILAITTRENDFVSGHQRDTVEGRWVRALAKLSRRDATKWPAAARHRTILDTHRSTTNPFFQS
jgi:hypothetical protein